MEQNETAATKALRILLPILSVLTVCVYPCLFQWFQNADEAPPDDMLRMLFVFVCIGAAFLLCALPVLKNMGHAGFFASIVMLVFCNIGLLASTLKAHFAWMHDRYLMIAVILLFLALGFFLLKHKGFPSFEFCTVITIAMACLIVLNFIRAFPTLYEIATAQRKGSSISATTAFQTDEKPNVYFFIMDEYGGVDSLEKYYDYDNSEFLDGLAEDGFQVSLTSHNSESIFTWTLIPNLLNLDYVVEDSLPHLVKTEYVDDPVLFQIFRNNGYSVNLIDHRDFLGHTGCNVLTRPQISDSVGDYLFDNSALGMIPRLRVWLKEKLQLSSNEYYVSELQQVMALAENCTDYIGDGPTFTIAYLQSPHLPFVMDATGTPRYTGTHNLIDKYYYLDQLKWLNSVLNTVVDNILANDPNSIIILQSDHGSRYPAQVSGVDGQPELNQPVENPIMQNILNCVYVKGQEIDIDGLSGINTLRQVLNTVFGTEIEMLEEPTGYITTSTDWK